MLLPMVDGGILEVRYDSSSYGGCDTCDYGSSYIRSFDVELTTGTIEFSTDEMYDYAVSEDFMFRTILQNTDEIKRMTEHEFSVWLENIIKKEVGSCLDYFKFYIN